jgi:hypothetical protein
VSELGRWAHGLKGVALGGRGLRGVWPRRGMASASVSWEGVWPLRGVALGNRALEAHDLQRGMASQGHDLRWVWPERGVASEGATSTGVVF